MQLMTLKVSQFLRLVFPAFTHCRSPGMLWLLVDVAEWRTFSHLPDDPKRCVSIILSHRRDFLTADVRGRHMVTLQPAELASPVHACLYSSADFHRSATALVVASRNAHPNRSFAEHVHRLVPSATYRPAVRRFSEQVVSVRFIERKECVNSLSKGADQA